MKINYHFHSGVSVECGSDLFVFDYYRQGLDVGMLEKFANIYVFVSHGHRDHFDKIILSWAKNRPDINYIFSHDVEKTIGDMVRMKPGESRFIKDIAVTAMDSTDEGSAFFVKSNGGNIFHSGDLNWWHWEGEPDDYNLGMERKFKREINKLKGEHIDVAFIPVDKRLESSMYYSIDYLMSALDVETVCPIHFWDDWSYIKKVKEDLENREYYKKIYFYGR